MVSCKIKQFRVTRVFRGLNMEQSYRSAFLRGRNSALLSANSVLLFVATLHEENYNFKIKIVHLRPRDGTERSGEDFVCPTDPGESSPHGPS